MDILRRDILWPTFIITTLILLDQWIFPNFILFHPWKWVILFFFLITSGITHSLTQSGLESKGESFIRFYFYSMLFRMLFSLIFIGFSLFIRVENIFLFVGNFFCIYLLFIVFEIYNLLGKLRANS